MQFKGLRNAVRKFLQSFGYDIIKLYPTFKRGTLDIAAVSNEYR